MAALIAHLWQSLLCLALVAALAATARRRSAHVRLWLWRIAAIKWLVPFSLLTALGGWLGYPVRFAGDPPPALAVTLTGSLTRWFSPAGWDLFPIAELVLLAALLLAAAAALRLTLGRIHDDAIRARIETLRLEIDPDDRAPSLGFMRAALFTACALTVIVMPMMGGAVRASTHAHKVLEANIQNLSEARVTLRPARQGLGSRYFVDVDTRGVWIRNITVRELTGMAYGVNRFFVRGQHFRDGDDEDWLIDTRYDVRIEGPIIEPKRFDTYALRRTITRELAQNFGLEIYVNNECQKPCGKWGDRVLLEVAPDSWALVPKESARALEAAPGFSRSEEPALTQFNAFLAAFNSGDDGTLSRHLLEQVSAEWDAKPPIEETLLLLERTGGFDVLALEHRSPNELHGWVRARASGARMAVSFFVEAEPPHRISLYRFEMNARLQ
jgi:hypothetical protein